MTALALAFGVAPSFAPRLSAGAQGASVTNRGFVDGAAVAYPREATNDTTQLVGDLLLRDEVVVKAASWLQLAGGADARANSHDQVDHEWRVDFSDRGLLRPAISIRRLSATFSRGALVLDVGKQFIRWGKTDIVTPTDRFAPRDFLNVFDSELLAVTGVRAGLTIGGGTIDTVWVPRLTPSRVPLIDQRWTVPPDSPVPLALVNGGVDLPSGSQAGIRWAHTGAIEYSVSFFDGFNHLPTVDAVVRPFPDAAGLASAEPVQPVVVLTRTYPAIRSYGGDLAVPTRLVTIKGEAAYFSSPSPITDEYVLYGVQLERQSGEWAFLGGYAGEAVTNHRAIESFAPDRGMSQSFVGRASYTIDSNRSVAFEGVAHQNGHGLYARAEYSQARGAHWRATISSVLLAGDPDDFIGQYHRNSHVTMALRYSF